MEMVADRTSQNALEIMRHRENVGNRIGIEGKMALTSSKEIEINMKIRIDVVSPLSLSLSPSRSGIVPRIGLGMWQTLFMVSGAKVIKQYIWDNDWKFGGDCYSRRENTHTTDRGNKAHHKAQIQLREKTFINDMILVYDGQRDDFGWLRSVGWKSGTLKVQW